MFKVGDSVRILRKGESFGEITEVIDIRDGLLDLANNPPGFRADEVEKVFIVWSDLPNTNPSSKVRSLDDNPLLTILDETFDNARQLIIEKGGEYAADADVLANFRHEGEKLGLPMEVIWHVYIGKHLSAIDRYVRDIKDGKTDRPRMETLESRADDIITYMIHFKQMLKEREDVQT